MLFLYKIEESRSKNIKIGLVEAPTSDEAALRVARHIVSQSIRERHARRIAESFEDKLDDDNYYTPKQLEKLKKKFKKEQNEEREHEVREVLKRIEISALDDFENPIELQFEHRHEISYR